jgi:hypothetical protein
MRAMREAGPPIRWIVAAVPAAVLVVIVLYVVGVRNQAALLAIPFVAFVLVALIDRDGWRIRMAMSEVAGRQREHWRTGALPIDPPSADAWLSEHPDARPAERASVLVTAGRREEAIALLNAAVGDTPTETVGIARLRLTLDPSIDGDAAERTAFERLERIPEFAALPAEERRYHQLAASWSIAWLRIKRGAPWRRGFASAIRNLAPFHVSLRYRVFHVIQQFALPIAYLLALLIVWALDLGDALLRD